MRLFANQPDLFTPLLPQPARPAQPLARTGERVTLSLPLPADAAGAAGAPSPSSPSSPSSPPNPPRTQVPAAAHAPVAVFEGAAEAAVWHPQPQPALRLRVGPLAPETLHPALWRAYQVARAAHAVWPSGFAELDAHLPGGGWPAGMLTELLLPHPGVGELRLLAPVLVALQTQQRSVMWFDPPAQLCPWALGALGLDMRQHLVVLSRPRAAAPPPRGDHGWAQAPTQTQAQKQARVQVRMRATPPAADVLWALEQALKSGQVGALLAWLPSRLPADALRRLQLAAQLHEGPVFLLRAAEERSRASASPLRLLLSAWGPDLLRVAIVKRRGAPLADPLLLELPPALSVPALVRALRTPGPGSPGTRAMSWAAGAGAGRPASSASAAGADADAVSSAPPGDRVQQSTATVAPGAPVAHRTTYPAHPAHAARRTR